MEARPKALCEKYPHVANRPRRRVATRRACASLQALVDDTRWGSAGYPARAGRAEQAAGTAG